MNLYRHDVRLCLGSHVFILSKFYDSIIATWTVVKYNWQLYKYVCLTTWETSDWIEIFLWTALFNLKLYFQTGNKRVHRCMFTCLPISSCI